MILDNNHNYISNLVKPIMSIICVVSGSETHMPGKCEDHKLDLYIGGV